MASELVPNSDSHPARATQASSPVAWGQHPPAAWDPPAPNGDNSDAGVPWQRHLQALVRYKWLILAAAVLGVLGGLLAARFSKPLYQARATIWISAPTPPSREGMGPIRADELLPSTSWIELFRSFTITDSVVMKLGLYVTPAELRDTSLFRQLRVSDQVVPDDYVLAVGATGKQYTLTGSTGDVLETGLVTDSIGRRVGILWKPAAEELRPGRSVAFHIAAPRDASLRLLDRVTPELPPGSNFMRLTLTGDDPARTASTLNLWTKEFVSTAAELKRHNLTEFSRILEGQLQYAGNQLREAEIALETFRVNTITLPSENGPVIPGLEATKGPVFTNFFNRKIEFDNVRRDRDALQRVVTDVQGGQSDILAIASIPGVLQAPGAEGLNDAVQELYKKQAELRIAQRTYTDEHPTVKALDADIAQLRTQTIPRLATERLARLSERANDLNVRIEAESQQMRDIPARTIEEMRLRREVSVAENLYTSLQSRYEEAKLAEASAVPDVTTLDQATPPSRASANNRIRVFFVALGIALGLAIIAAILLDRLDHRFRYPEQAEDDLHVGLMGTVPTLRPSSGASAPEDADQIVESFRGVRLRLQHMTEPGQPIMCAITSAGSGDGKSLISANLALSLAEAGYRTLLIDGDTRRGALHTMFGTDRRPGLIECLAGSATATECLRPTSHPGLTLLPCGTRGRRNPELVAGAALPDLLSGLSQNFQAVVVDTPPLGAGIDAFALASACGSAVLVLRHGKTDLRMAAAKLELLRHLPIRLHGAIANEVRAAGTYRYYSYESVYQGVPEDVIEEEGTTASRDGRRFIEAG